MQRCKRRSLERVRCGWRPPRGCEIDLRAGRGRAVAQDNLARAIDLQEDALSRFRELGSLRWQSAALCELGTLYRTVGRPEDSKGYLDLALLLAEEVGDDLLIANACLELATAERLLGNARSAVDLAERAVRLYRPLGRTGLPNTFWRSRGPDPR